MSDPLDTDIAPVEKRRIQARWLHDSRVQHEWGIQVDNLGSVEMVGSRQDAIDAFIEHGGLALVQVTTQTYALPERCPLDVGERPYWMSPDQYDPCQCVLPIGHKGGCVCSHDQPDPNRNTPAKHQGGDA